MARNPRLHLLGFAQHVVQRGNHRQACFADDRETTFITDSNLAKPP